jgi:NAD(P)-dependent dehydrogenase (short-subunit alcohol dehydrogenase family)
MNRLAGKTAIITGGNSGIGFATASLFLEEGAKVIITGRREKAVAEAVEQLGKNAFGITSDAGNFADVKILPSKVREITELTSFSPMPEWLSSLHLRKHPRSCLIVR